MKLEFTEEASNDLERIGEFLKKSGVCNHQEIIEGLILGAENVLLFPRAGVKVSKARNPDIVRDYYYKKFCLRYLTTPTCLYVLRVWHEKENERNF